MEMGKVMRAEERNKQKNGTNMDIFTRRDGLPSRRERAPRRIVAEFARLRARAFVCLLRRVKLNGAVLVLVLKDGQRREAPSRDIAEVVEDDLVLLRRPD
jgi:hypothetical protein